MELSQDFSQRLIEAPIDSNLLKEYMFYLGERSHVFTTKNEYLACLSVMRQYIEVIDYHDSNQRLLSLELITLPQRTLSEHMGIAYVLGVLSESSIAISQTTFNSCLRLEIMSNFDPSLSNNLAEQNYAERCWQRYVSLLNDTFF